MKIPESRTDLFNLCREKNIPYSAAEPLTTPVSAVLSTMYPPDEVPEMTIKWIWNIVERDIFCRIERG